MSEEFDEGENVDRVRSDEGTRVRVRSSRSEDVFFGRVITVGIA